MNVLHIINSPGLGGAETMVRDILTINSDHTVFCLRYDKKDRFKVLGERVMYGTYSKWYKFNPVIFFRLLKTIKKQNINIIHVHLANSLFYAIIIKFLQPRLVLVYHELSEIVYSRKLQYLLKVFISKINKIIAVSDFLKDELLKHGVPENKIVVLPTFVNIELFSKKTDKTIFDKFISDYNLKDKFIIGFVGRLIERKGWKELLQAYSILIKKNLSKNFLLLIVGDGQDKPKMLKFVIEHELQNHVLFLGYIDQIKLVYEALNLLVMSSYYEGLSMTQLEAVCCGVPVLSSDGGGLTEIGTSNEITYFKNKDVGSLSQSLYKCVNEYDICLAKALKAREIIHKFSLDTYIQSLDKIYQSLL